MPCSMRCLRSLFIVHQRPPLNILPNADRKTPNYQGNSIRKISNTDQVSQSSDPYIGKIGFPLYRQRTDMESYVR